MQATHIKCNIPPLPKTSNHNLADQTTQNVLAIHYNPRPENKNQFLRACLNNLGEAIPEDKHYDRRPQQLILLGHCIWSMLALSDV